MYHANLFPLTRHEPFPVNQYQASIDPPPSNKPQLYQILGIVAKQIMRQEKIPAIVSGGQIVSLSSSVVGRTGYVAEIPQVGRFSVTIQDAGSSIVRIDQFDEYSRLVNRLADIALTSFSPEYYKFHPDAPYILRDEPYFDVDLIEKTGIIDSKKYYRGLHMFGGQPVFVLNRETELRSNKNLLIELKSLKKNFEYVKGNRAGFDFYDPPREFIGYINSLLRGKAADILGYPGPRIREIKEITWKYRASDATPGSTKSHIGYLRDTYGIEGLDPNQPLVVYEIEQLKRIQYHLPEVLSIGHTFHDLEKRIPSWQRRQVWGSIHPDCKNQLQKIHGILFQIDETLRKFLPEVYPKVVEISTEAADVSTLVSQPIELTLEFGNKVLTAKPPYDMSFYHSYANKNVLFMKPIGPTKALVCLKDRSKEKEAFLTALAQEHKLRNNTELTYDYGELDWQRTDYSHHQIVLSIGDGDGDEENDYRKCKEVMQNDLGVVHQHVTEEHANESSIMALVMQLNLKLGGDPWLLPKQENIPYVVGIHSYLNPYSGRKWIFAIAQNGRGALIKQFDPVEPTDFEGLAGELSELNESNRRVLYLLSFDRFGILGGLKDTLERTNEKIEYCIAEIDDQDYLRFFQTWIPKKAPRFGKAAAEIAKSPIEAYEKAPEGVALRSDDDTYFLITGRTIEKDATKRGCPMPIKLSVKSRRGDGWETADIVKYVFGLCMMGRTSGHMTRFPAPIHYLESYAYYCNNYGVPKHEQIKQRIFHI